MYFSVERVVYTEITTDCPPHTAHVGFTNVFPYYNRELQYEYEYSSERSFVSEVAFLSIFQVDIRWLL